MSSTYGERIRLSIFGQSHGPAIGMTMDGIPAGLPVDIEKLQTFLNRRAPGHNAYSTPRKETDIPQFISGVVDGFTCGAPITAIIPNTNTRSQDYSHLKDCPRPGHADFTAQMKYNGYQDVAGGGHFSGRLTAPLCIAGGLCKQWLETEGITIGAHISMIAGIADAPLSLDMCNPDFSLIQKDFPVINIQAGCDMQKEIEQARKDGDSVGGVIECIATGLPVGLGEPMFGGMESRIAQIVYGIPAVKGLEFGSGFAGSYMRGSENNDAFSIEQERVVTQTNNSGGILGGITNGMPLIFRAAIKPTPSIAKQQVSVSLSKMQQQSLQVGGRHDPCIVPRAVPVVEAAAALAIMDTWLMQYRKGE